MNPSDARGFPILETPRLWLRAPRRGDAQALLSTSQDPDVMRFYGMPPFVSEGEALEEIAWFSRLVEEGEGIRWIITLKPNDLYIGDIGFHRHAAAHARAEIGFKLARAHWRQGIAGESAEAVISYGFEAMGLNRIEALVDPRNAACRGLLDALGFTREGNLRQYELEGDRFIDLEMFARLRSD